MKIAIIGTRGIPNNYGGFEQLAEYLSLGFLKKGHEVFVYNSSRHKFQEKKWNGINLIHQFDPEFLLGTIGQFFYDFNCILNSRKHNFDAIINLGYTSSSIFLWLFSKKSNIITNMDGLEWKRSKYSRYVQRFLMFSERLAVKKSTMLVADSIAIQTYLLKKYNVKSHFIAYGACLFEKENPLILNSFNLNPFSYSMLIARMEPENNIEMILEGVVSSKSDNLFLVVGNYSNKYGMYLYSKFSLDKRIIFTGPIYDFETINNLRFFSNLYFHGHSVGGTNPSLLEAMGCKALICAHNNEFNKSVLGSNCYYFDSNKEVSKILDETNKSSETNQLFINNNYLNIKDNYSWEKIINQYENLIIK